ncbi:MAG: LuxR C-terminal-related transcriptional regulator [Devosiaceae bacterium]|nr:LuxR C-terminal-related transcriptional regulator [Devosiaceae bacterium]
MIELEKLYKAAEKHLEISQRNWDEFSRDFKTIFDAEMLMFVSPSNASEIYLQPGNKLIANTKPEIIDEFFKHSVGDFAGILKDPKNPFEPARRSDHTSDEEYIKLDVYQSFGVTNGVFYLMLVFAVLPDGSNLVMVVWRAEKEHDFSDLEKQRLALFMRHISTFIKAEKTSTTNAPVNEIEAFGKKYSLTDSEIKVLSALLQGHSLKFIAKETGRSYVTVRWHVQNILEKCQVKTQKNLLSEFYRLIKA